MVLDRAETRLPFSRGIMATSLLATGVPTEEAYRLAGTVALRDGGLQRAFRDLHAGGQHFFASNAASIDWAKTLLEASTPNHQGN